MMNHVRSMPHVAPVTHRECVCIISGIRSMLPLVGGGGGELDDEERKEKVFV